LYHQGGLGGLGWFAAGSGSSLFLRVGRILGSQVSRNQRLVRLARYRQLGRTVGAIPAVGGSGRQLLLVLQLLLLLLLQGRGRRGRRGDAAHVFFGRETDHLQIVGPRLPPSLVANATNRQGLTVVVGRVVQAEICGIGR
jgi:hypothetical protein